MSDTYLKYKIVNDVFYEGPRVPRKKEKKWLVLSMFQN